MSAPAKERQDARAYAGAWTYRYGFSVVLFGYGVAVGPCRPVNPWNHSDRKLVSFFRNHAYRGLFS